jgi:hypothetical protein
LQQTELQSAARRILRWHALCFSQNRMRTLIQLKPLQALGLFLSIFIANLSFAQNGGERHGGDLYVGEFQEIERGILPKIDRWVADGSLKITSAELEKVKLTVARHVVISKPHACLTGEKTDGTCKIANDERDVVNQPFSNPPLVIIGRIRWDGYANRPKTDKEILVLHEMLEVSLTKSSKLVRDKTFELSYQHKNELDILWKEQLRSRHINFLKDIRREEANFESVDMTVLSTFLKTMKFSSDYKNCVAMTGKSQKEREARLKVCLPLVNQFLGAVQDYLKNDMQKRLNEITANLDRMNRDYQAYVASTYNLPEVLPWRNWATSEQNILIQEAQAAFKASNEVISRDAVFNILDKASPYSGDLSENIVFVFDEEKGALPMIKAMFEQSRAILTKMLYESNDKSMERVNAQIDPPTS